MHSFPQKFYRKFSVHYKAAFKNLRFPLKETKSFWMPRRPSSSECSLLAVVAKWSRTNNGMIKKWKRYDGDRDRDRLRSKGI